MIAAKNFFTCVFLGLLLLSYSMIGFSDSSSHSSPEVLWEADLSSTDSQISVPQWLNEQYIWWTEEINQENGLSCTAVYLQDWQAEEGPVCLYQTSPSNLNHDLYLRILDETPILYFSSISKDEYIQGKVLFSKESFLQSDVIVFPPEPRINMRMISPQENLLLQQPVSNNINKTYVVICPLNQPEKAFTSQDLQKSRYSLFDDCWSLSGSYFCMQNLDVYGMENFDSFAEILAVPYENRPQKAQFDVFNHEGNLQFSVESDWFMQGNPSALHHLEWLSDHLLMVSTSYSEGASNITYYDRVYSVSGECLWQIRYNGFRSYFADTSLADKFYYKAQLEDGVHYFAVDCDTDHVEDYGCMVSQSEAGISKIIPNPTDARLILIYNTQSHTGKMIRVEE